MVEEEKKMEEKKQEEPKAAKKEEAKAGDKKEAAAGKPEEPPPPPPPPEIVLRVYMHCEGCARKVRRCLKGFEGVEDVQTDCRTQKVVVKGEKADPMKVLERVQRKSHRQVELLSPIPKPPAPEEPKKAEEKEAPKPEENKEVPQVVTVVLKVHMHCEACAQEIKRRILRMKGVENVEADLKSSQVTVKGVFDPPKLVDYVYKRTGKHAAIVKQEPVPEPEKKEEEKGKEGKEKADDAGAEKKAEAAAPAKEDGGGGGGEGESAADAAPAAAEGESGEEAAAMLVEMRKNEFYYNYPVNYQVHPYPARFDLYSYAYPPQIFSDENPNACSVM